MAKRYRCESCKGTYGDIGTDGTVYYHTCPPLSDPEFTALSPAEKAGKSVGAERDGKRDERIVLNPRMGAVGPIAPGKGATEI